jgi:hypothetical protein
VDPEAVSGQEIGDLGDGKSDPAALDMDVDLGTDQIEGRSFRIARCCDRQKQSQCWQQDRYTERETATHGFYCTDAGVRLHGRREDSGRENPCTFTLVSGYLPGEICVGYLAEST